MGNTFNCLLGLPKSTEQPRSARKSLGMLKEKQSAQPKPSCEGSPPCCKGVPGQPPAQLPQTVQQKGYPQRLVQAGLDYLTTKAKNLFL